MDMDCRLRRRAPGPPGIVGVPSWLSPARILYWLVLVIALGGLFLPALGPLVDHHIAERFPSHDHIYLGPPMPHHPHFYEYSDGSYAGMSRSNAPPLDVVYLTSLDAAAQSLLLISAVPPFGRALTFLAGGDEPSLLTRDATETPPREFFVAPAEKPPPA